MEDYFDGPKMNTQEKIQLINKAVWESITDLPNNVIESTDDWFQVTTNQNPSPHMNGIYRCQKDDLNELQLNEMVLEVVRYYKDMNYNFRWKVSSTSSPKGLSDVLVKNGMILKDLLYGFLILPSEFNVSSKREKIDIQKLNSSNFEDWLLIQEKGWGVSSEGIKQLRSNSELVISKNSHTYISYYLGKPAGAAGLLMMKDYAYMLGGVVTPEFRRKGLYRALIDARFADLSLEGLPAVFHCVSNTSAPIIQNMGFEKICEIESFELP